MRKLQTSVHCEESQSAKARNYAIAAAATAVALLAVRILLLTFGIFGPGFMD